MADATAWMPLYIGDYLRDTQHLSTAEHGAYLLLIMNAWGRGGFLPSDPERLRRIVGMDAKDWRTAWPVLREFFEDGPDGLHHKRVDSELAKASEVSGKRKAAADARWSKRDTTSNANAYANASGLHVPGTSQSQSQPQPQSDRVGEDKEITSLLAFAGKTVRLNKRDFDKWAAAYHAIPDLRAELVALDDWITGQDEVTRKKWFHIASGSLSKKHQAELRAAKAPEGEAKYVGP